MEKPPTLTAKERQKPFRIYFANLSVDTTKMEYEEYLCQAQRDADLEWFIKWGDQHCKEHGFRHRNCTQCWQEFQKMVLDG